MPPHKWPPAPPPVVKCKTVPLCMKSLSNRRKSCEMVVQLYLDHHAVWTGCSFYEDTRLQSCERRQQHNYLLSCGYHLFTISQIGCIMLCNLHNIIHNTWPRGNITWQPNRELTSNGRQRLQINGEVSPARTFDSISLVAFPLLPLQMQTTRTTMQTNTPTKGTKRLYSPKWWNKCWSPIF